MVWWCSGGSGDLTMVHETRVYVHCMSRLIHWQIPVPSPLPATPAILAPTSRLRKPENEAYASLLRL